MVALRLNDILFQFLWCICPVVYGEKVFILCRQHQALEDAKYPIFSIGPRLPLWCLFLFLVNFVRFLTVSSVTSAQFTQPHLKKLISIICTIVIPLI